jgi:hypothetical protein
MIAGTCALADVDKRAPLADALSGSAILLATVTKTMEVTRGVVARRITLAICCRCEDFHWVGKFMFEKMHGTRGS